MARKPFGQFQPPGSTRQGDRLGRSIGAFSGSIRPTKGKGHGRQGEAVYLDLLDRWDKNGRWQAWRKSMSLSQSLLVGAAERFTAVQALHRAPIAPAPAMDDSPILLAGFTAPASPDGRWTVAISPRGTMTTPAPVGAIDQDEVFINLSDDPDAPPQRLLRLTLRPPTPLGAPLGAPPRAGPPIDFNASMIGEIVEDSCIAPGVLDPDPTDGIGLLIVAIHEADFMVYLDATRLWRRERTSDGRIVLREVPIAADQPCPRFRDERFLVNALALSCNCPSYVGLEYERLQGRGRNAPLGAQDLFPQRAPSGLQAPLREPDDVAVANPEGVRRRFAPLSWARIPGEECKHCHAVRWALGAPLAEPSDMQSLASDYWNDMRRMRFMEDMDFPLADPRFMEQLRGSILNEQAFSQLDQTMLAASVGDVVGITPQRTELGLGQLALTPAQRAALRVAGPSEYRFNEQRYIVNPEDDYRARFGDWWIGRGTSNLVLAYAAPGTVMNQPAIVPLPPSANLPTAIP